METMTIHGETIIEILEDWIIKETGEPREIKDIRITFGANGITFVLELTDDTPSSSS